MNIDTTLRVIANVARTAECKRDFRFEQLAQRMPAACVDRTNYSIQAEDIGIQVDEMGVINLYVAEAAKTNEVFRIYACLMRGAFPTLDRKDGRIDLVNNVKIQVGSIPPAPAEESTPLLEEEFEIINEYVAISQSKGCAIS